MGVSFLRSVPSKLKEITGRRAAAVDLVNNQIGQKRGKFITIIPGQEMIYTAKEKEAERFLSFQQEPSNLKPYPFLSAEIGITAPTAYELAQIWANRAAQLKTVAAQLEFVRVRAIAAIEAAPDAPGIAQVMADFDDDLGVI